jgi:hypothetical protein
MTATQAGAVYVLHFAAPFHGANGRHIGARHYIGWTGDPTPERRVAEHLAGQGSPLVAAVVAAGIAVELARWQPGDRGLERRLHNCHGTRVCPHCRRPRRRSAGRQLRLLGGGRAAPTTILRRAA